jgi:Holliday junction resolvase RusA-like endonuclease
MTFPEGALDLRIRAFFGVPKSDSLKTAHKKLTNAIRPTKKPDMDNIMKIVADALNGVAFHDDSQIVDCMVRKFYSDNPRVEITVQNLEENL